MDMGSHIGSNIGPQIGSHIGAQTASHAFASTLAELASSLGVIAAFVALGLGSAAAFRWMEGGAQPDDPYHRDAMSDTDAPLAAEPRLWLVDGFNLLHVTLLRGDSRNGWWRSSSRERVVELARSFDAPGAEVVVVFDGDTTPPPATEARETGPRVVFSATADEWLLAAVRTAPDPAQVAVVTADRQLGARVRHRGAQVVSPSAFAARCRRSSPVDPPRPS